MSDIGIDQKVTSIEEKFATPRIVKNTRTGQAYSVGIGLPKETFTAAFFSSRQFPSGKRG